MKIRDIESIENDIIECFAQCINEEAFRDSIHYIVRNSSMNILNLHLYKNKEYYNV